METPHRQLKILVVDDTYLTREVLCEHLRFLDHDPIPAADGEQAIKRFIESSPDIVLMDMVMPGMNGIETTQAIRQLPNAHWVPIIMLSAHSDEAEFLNALNGGCDDYLAKPIKFPVLQAKMNALQRIAAMQREIERSQRELQKFYQQAEHEMQLTRHIMERLVRRDDGPDQPESWCVAAAGVSGDLLLHAQAENGLRYIMLADATGHGLAAAVTLLPVANVFYAMTAKGFNVASIVAEMNRQVRTYCPIDRFVALALVAINSQDQVIEIWNGGIPPLLLFDNHGHEQRRFKSRHLPLGILAADEFKANIEYFHYQQELQLVMFSDGLIEAGLHDPFGIERTIAALSAAPPAQRLHALQLAFMQRMQGAAPHDDISCALVECPLAAVPAQTGQQIGIAEHAGDQAAGGEDVQSDWQLDTLLSAEQLKSVDLVPMVMEWAHAMGLSRAHSGTFFLVITELFVNALEHGLLSLSSERKRDADGFERFIELRRQRLQSLQRGQIQLQLSYRREGSHGIVRVYLRDTGPGFDTRRLPGYSLADTRALAGRGIALVREFCRKFEYNRAGNAVYAELVC